MPSRSLHIQVENKGSSVLDNRQRPHTILNHAASILEKKKNAAAVTLPGVRYGTITVIDPRPDGVVRCYLCDPEPELIFRTPREAKLLSRMRFLQGWISFQSPNSQLAAALASRLSALEHSSQLEEFDRVPLLRGNGNEFEVSRMFGNPSPFFQTKSRIHDDLLVAL